MTKKLQRLLDELKGSGSSAALAVADHLETVAANGREYAKDAYLMYEAEVIRDMASTLIENMQSKKRGTKQ